MQINKEYDYIIELLSDLSSVTAESSRKFISGELMNALSSYNKMQQDRIMQLERDKDKIMNVISHSPAIKQRELEDILRQFNFKVHDEIVENDDDKMISLMIKKINNSGEDEKLTKSEIESYKTYVPKKRKGCRKTTSANKLS